MLWATAPWLCTPRLDLGSPVPPSPLIPLTFCDCRWASLEHPSFSIGFPILPGEPKRAVEVGTPVCFYCPASLQPDAAAFFTSLQCLLSLGFLSIPHSDSNPLKPDTLSPRFSPSPFKVPWPCSLPAGAPEFGLGLCPSHLHARDDGHCYCYEE